MQGQAGSIDRDKRSRGRWRAFEVNDYFAEQKGKNSGTKVRHWENARVERVAMITRRSLLANGAVVATVAGMKLPVWARLVDTGGATGADAAEASAAASRSGQVEHGLLLGVDYYPDQTPERLWEEDARMMAEAGLTNVRVAEFAWSLMET